MRKKLYDKLISNYILHLVIGEDIPANAPNEFHTIKLYVRKNNNLKLYADISLLYLINYSKFININKDDPTYIFEQRYNPATEGYKYACMIKPFGDMKGVYRILNDQNIKIQSIEPLFELENDVKLHTLVKKNKKRKI